MQENNQVPVENNVVVEQPKKKDHTVLIVVLVVVGAVFLYLGITVFSAARNVSGLLDEAKLKTFVMETQTIAQESMMEWTNYSKGTAIVYSFNNGVTCKNQIYTTLSPKINYYVKMDETGKIKQLIVNDGTYGYEYEGEDLNITSISKNDVHLLTEKNVTIPSCD